MHVSCARLLYSLAEHCHLCAQAHQELHARRCPPACMFPAAAQVEWVQWNLMLGVDHITVYLADTSFALPELLRPYMERGIVDVRQWVLPELLPHELLSQQVPLINDCLYRSLDRFEWVRALLMLHACPPRLLHPAPKPRISFAEHGQASCMH